MSNQPLIWPEKCQITWKNCKPHCTNVFPWTWHPSQCLSGHPSGRRLYWESHFIGQPQSCRFHGKVVIVEIFIKDSQGWFSMGLYIKDVVHIPPPHSKYFVLGLQELSFKLSMNKFKHPIIRLAFDGAIHVPMSVEWSVERTNKLFVSTNQISWQRSAVGNACYLWRSKNFSQAVMPSYVWCWFMTRRHRKLE